MMHQDELKVVPIRSDHVKVQSDTIDVSGVEKIPLNPVSDAGTPSEPFAAMTPTSFVNVPHLKAPAPAPAKVDGMPCVDGPCHGDSNSLQGQLHTNQSNGMSAFVEAVPNTSVWSNGTVDVVVASLSDNQELLSEHIHDGLQCSSSCNGAYNYNRWSGNCWGCVSIFQWCGSGTPWCQTYLKVNCASCHSPRRRRRTRRRRDRRRRDRRRRTACSLQCYGENNYNRWTGKCWGCVSIYSWCGSGTPWCVTYLKDRCDCVSDRRRRDRRRR